MSDVEQIHLSPSVQIFWKDRAPFVFQFSEVLPYDTAWGFPAPMLLSLCPLSSLHLPSLKLFPPVT